MRVGVKVIALIKSAHQLVVLSANRCARVVFSASQGSGKSRVSISVQIGYVTIFWSSTGISPLTFVRKELDCDQISSNIAEEAFEDALGVDVDIGPLIGQIFKQRIYEIRASKQEHHVSTLT